MKIVNMKGVAHATASPVADDCFDNVPFKFEGILKQLNFRNL